MVYLSWVIASFRDKHTERLFRRERVKRFERFERVALRKLVQIHAAATLDDLRIPLHNRLEALKGDRAGQYSIRINDQFRVCFIWNNGNAERVEITNYH